MKQANMPCLLRCRCEFEDYEDQLAAQKEPMLEARLRYAATGRTALNTQCARAEGLLKMCVHACTHVHSQVVSTLMNHTVSRKLLKCKKEKKRGSRAPPASMKRHIGPKHRTSESYSFA